ncbi:MogA/MoaB family molybdenum cofactor biosynthesis protein [Thiovibrio sp. JS02]
MTVYSAAVLTISDKGSRGEREDTSGPQLRTMLSENGFTVAAYKIVPDNIEEIRDGITAWVDKEGIDLILTTGGTGVAPSDLTPEATRPVLDREIPGIGEAMRLASLRKTPNAMLSRGIAGIRKESLIINLPGSKKAAEENLEAVLPALAHAIYKIKGGSKDCGS